MHMIRMGIGAALVAAMATACGRNHADSTATPSLSTASAASVGQYLTDGKGRAVYMFVIDGKDMSACTDACAAAWPPLPPSAPRRAGLTVRRQMIGAIDRSDNRRQTTYNGMPVYYYEDDEHPGDIKGQGKNEFGGLWYLVSPDGNAIRPGAQGTAAAR